jgi:hypothetical protein
MFDFAALAIGGADKADRITAVALNFEMKGNCFAFNGTNPLTASQGIS